MIKRVAALMGLGLCVLAPAMAQVQASEAWVRATVAQQKATGAFMRLQSTRDARLIEVRCMAAGISEIHEMRMEGSTMKMHAVDGVDLPAGRWVEFKPGAQHLMLMQLSRQLLPGDKLPLQLVVEDRQSHKRETVEVQAEVRAMQMGASASAAH